jgi:hypothetical protein
MVDEPTDERRRRHLIAKDLAPLFEALFDVKTVEACS